MKLKIIVYFITFQLLSFTGQGQSSFPTYYELHQFNETPSYQQTISYCKELARSEKVTFQVFGTSHQGLDLPLLIYDAAGNFSPEDVKLSGNRILLIQAAIHAGEPDGKDAGFLLFRDIALLGKFKEELKNVTILFIPILNVDGHERFGPHNRINQNGPKEMGWRTNALNLNLNRDYLKADAKEMKAFLELWHKWQPDFFIDTHSTNGGDYQYPLTYAMSIYGDADKTLTQWIKNDYLAPIEKNMDSLGFPIFPYVTYRSWHDPRSGLISGVGHPMYSNSYVAELNRPALLIETHMLKPYKVRVEATYHMILETIKILNKDRSLQEIIRSADELCTSENFRKQPFPLRYENTNDSTIIDFKGVEYQVVKSDLSGGNWFIYNSTQPVTYSIPWFNRHKVVHQVLLPEAYIVPVEYSEVIERLKAHGIEMTELQEPAEITVETYTFSDVKLSSRSTEGRQTAGFTTNTITEKHIYHRGSVIIPTSQPRIRIIAHALEPMAPGSFAYWGFFNSVFERSEYFESYAMEKIAREMLAENPALKQSFEKAVEQNPSLQQNPGAVLNWFYEQSPYFDQRYNKYPVGRILTSPTEAF